MIEVSITEVVLFAWAFIATAFWYDAVRRHDMFKLMTMKIFKGICDGDVKITETETGFDFETVRKS